MAKKKRYTVASTISGGGVSNWRGTVRDNLTGETFEVNSSQWSKMKDEEYDSSPTSSTLPAGAPEQWQGVYDTYKAKEPLKAIDNPDAAIDAYVNAMGGDPAAAFRAMLLVDPSIAGSPDAVTTEDVIKFLLDSGGSTVQEAVGNAVIRATNNPDALRGSQRPGATTPEATTPEGGGAGGGSEPFYDFSDAGGAGAGGGSSAYPPGAYFDYLSRLQAPETYGGGDFYNYLRGQLPAGGPGTAGEFYTGVQSVMSPLSNLGGDFWDFLGRMSNPSAYMPGQFYTQLGTSMSPISSMPDEFWSMMQSPDYVAEGMGMPQTNVFSSLASSGGNAAAFLSQLLQGNPELAMNMVQGLIGMQQQSALDFLPFLLGPAGGAYSNTASTTGQQVPPEDQVEDLR